MNWEPLKRQLEQMLDTSVRVDHVPQQDWAQDARFTEDSQLVRFMLEEQSGKVMVLSVEKRNQAGLSVREQELVALAIHLHKSNGTLQDIEPDLSVSEKKQALLVKRWLLEQLSLGYEAGIMPDSFRECTALHTRKLPLLISAEVTDNSTTVDEDLRRLLESFFDSPVFLVPITDREWLVLVSDEGLLDMKEDERTSYESERTEEALEAIGLGLHDMIVNEWVGECHLAMDYPMIPSEELLATVVSLRETVALGRQYRIGSYIHFPWLLNLERLLSLLSDSEKRRFVERILRKKDYALESEMLQTLEQFFELDCNVSETAKHLYIHRNTLLYRLDRFKQDTGLDVRNFSHAVLVKTALLLYKVTKRK